MWEQAGTNACAASSTSLGTATALLQGRWSSNHVINLTSAIQKTEEICLSKIRSAKIHGRFSHTSRKVQKAILYKINPIMVKIDWNHYMKNDMQHKYLNYWVHRLMVWLRQVIKDCACGFLCSLISITIHNIETFQRKN